jgi:1-deoxy-D-xylulose-5-phosphate synthase
MAATAMDVADRLEAHGFGVTVVDPRWVKPVAPELVELAEDFKLVATIEDNGRAGGVGSMIAQAVRDAGIETPVRDFGIPQEFLQHAKRPAVLQEIGLTGQELAREITELLSEHHGDALNAPDPAGDRPGNA